MPGGHLIVTALGVLVASGWTDGVLSRWGVSPGLALFWLFAALSGSFVDIMVTAGPPSLALNVGGSLVPAALCLLLAGRERVPDGRARVFAVPVIAGAAVWAAGQFQNGPGPGAPAGTWPVHAGFGGPAVLAALIGVALGRSPLVALAGGAAAVPVAGLLQFLEFLLTGVPGQVRAGGGPAFDAAVLAGVLAAALAEAGRSLRRARRPRVR